MKRKALFTVIARLETSTRTTATGYGKEQAAAQGSLLTITFDNDVEIASDEQIAADGYFAHPYILILGTLNE